MQNMCINVENIDMHEDIIHLPQTNAPFSVTLCGISYCDGSYEIYRKSSNIYVMEYVISGTGTVSENGVSFTASTGDVYFLKADRQHRYYSSKNNPWEKVWFNFSGQLADYITKAYQLSELTHVHAPELKVFFDSFLGIVKTRQPELRAVYQIATSPVYGQNMRKMAETLNVRYEKDIERLSNVLRISIEELTPIVFMIISVMLDYVVWDDYKVAQMQMNTLYNILSGMQKRF